MRTGPLDWGYAGAPMAGERESGDRLVVRAFRGGALICVIDALGHGEKAAEVAGLAAAVLEREPAMQSTALMRSCHERLRGTRGAAIAIGSIDRKARSLAWLAVGSVCGVLLRAGAPAASLLVRGGMVGSQFREGAPMRVGLVKGDTLVVATDGIGQRFAEGIRASLAPQALADAIQRDYARSTDDSLVLVARYVSVAV